MSTLTLLNKLVLCRGSRYNSRGNKYPNINFQCKQVFRNDKMTSQNNTLDYKTLATWFLVEYLIICSQSSNDVFVNHPISIFGIISLELPNNFKHSFIRYVYDLKIPAQKNML